jgi:hypothetical protein
MKMNLYPHSYHDTSITNMSFKAIPTLESKMLDL